jgi:phage gpG-like protein
MPAYVLSNKLRVASLYNFGFDFNPSVAVTAKNFDKLEIDIRSFREPLKRSIQTVIAPSIGKNFLSGGRTTQWEALNDNTLPVKNNAGSKFPVEDPLLRSGLLMKTMQQLNIWTITTVDAQIESLPGKIWYGNLHQGGVGSAPTSAAKASGGTREGFLSMIDNVLAGGGGEGGRGQYLPARPFAMVQTEDLNAIVDVFEIWMNERIVARLGL